MTAVASRPGPAVAAGLLGCVLLVGCTTEPGPRDSAGTVTTSAAADAYGPQVGDCTGPITTGTASQVTLLPCEEPHFWEVFAATDLAGEEYPGTGKVQDDAESFCNDEFQAFTGESVSKSGYDLVVLQPTEQTWDSAADRAVTCLAGTRDGGIEGTLRGAEK